MARARAHIFWLGLMAMLAAVSAALAARNTRFRQVPAVHSQENRSVWDGVYTEEQAQRGEALYRQQCSSCHGDKLTGKESDNVPSLTGQDFEAQWKGRTVGDLFKKILRKMPQDDPGTLTPQQSADLIAFLLRFNKFPGGKNELPPENEPLAAILFDGKKPEQKSSGQ
jgi:S-disulfanyl-L-cysteine oxidoreductase SoxD